MPLGPFATIVRPTLSPNKEFDPVKNKSSANIVLIDDDFDLLELLSSYFKQRGFNVQAFNQAEEALIEIDAIPELALASV